MPNTQNAAAPKELTWARQTDNCWAAFPLRAGFVGSLGIVCEEGDLWSAATHTGKGIVDAGRRFRTREAAQAWVERRIRKERRGALSDG